ncbi:BT0820 family HAD-type phosphatase [Ancylomarina sp. 16SWW S1-10-2]|uniref:BT0820 family HAD-type phosphatase n=1 Tax=Ancylomarina sp. 16SWW S1-10-2 TaxID=2499681 RepID=UPI0012AE21C7|nr:hydrolase [Ancylomarina sp. 16SWW S1-10-2]MRT94388.1 hydrolase [Ancylomarina sp. 16SWW S1-10-2]
MKIAVDFDGTIVEHRYPYLGKEIPFAFDSLKLIQKQGHDLILWTYRSGKELKEAVEYCRTNGLEFYAVNKNYPEEVFDESISRKINADIYIDDRNFGGLPDWGAIYLKIVGKEYNASLIFEQKNASGLNKLFRKYFMK